MGVVISSAPIKSKSLMKFSLKELYYDYLLNRAC
nr:MAG TPA: hypothetical protein [Inoviridae sp.]